jgi:hypothetical protein
MNPDPEKMAGIAAPQATVSDKIRALGAAGYARADIARFLGKRYQHVRNVLEDDAQRSGAGYTLGRADLSGVQKGPKPFERNEDDETLVQARGNGAYRLVVRPDGSILLPREVAVTFEAGPGGVVMGRLVGDEFKLISARTGLERARAFVRSLNIPPGVSLADELIADRRAEAEREVSDDY